MTEKEKTNEMKKLYNELVAILLKRAGVKEEDIYDTAMKLWVSKNIDLLTASEMKKFKGIMIP